MGDGHRGSLASSQQIIMTWRSLQTSRAVFESIEQLVT